MPLNVATKATAEMDYEPQAHNTPLTIVRRPAKTRKPIPTNRCGQPRKPAISRSLKPQMPSRWANHAMFIYLGLITPGPQQTTPTPNGSYKSRTESSAEENRSNNSNDAQVPTNLCRAQERWRFTTRRRHGPATKTVRPSLNHNSAAS